MRRLSQVQALPPKIDSQLLGGVPSGLGSAQTYQSALSLVRLSRLSANQGCLSEQCEITWSMITLSPSACAFSSSRSKSPSVPKIGSTSR